MNTWLLPGGGANPVAQKARRETADLSRKKYRTQELAVP